jgi:hypothetical protein
VITAELHLLKKGCTNWAEINLVLYLKHKLMQRTKFSYTLTSLTNTN